MKKLISIVFTLAFIIGVNYGLTVLLGVQFIDFSVMVGILTIGIIKFFNSSGGMTSRSIDMSVQATTGVKQDAIQNKFSPTTGFYTAIVYTVISAVATFVYYKDYFL